MRPMIFALFSEDQLLVSFEKLLVDTEDGVSKNAFESTYLAERMVTILEVEDAVTSNHLEAEDAVTSNHNVKTFLIDKFDDSIFFSYPTEKNKSSLVFMAGHSTMLNATETVSINKELWKGLCPRTSCVMQFF